MDRIFTVLNETVQKSTIKDFREYLTLYKGVKKWIISSDCSIGDPNKPNDVISFVFFPYILSFTKWQKMINALQKQDINHTNEISDDFCEFTQSGLIFTFSFLLSKDGNCFDRWQDKKSLQGMINSWIVMIDSWIKNKPYNEKHYLKLKEKLNDIRNDMNNDTNAEGFNLQLLTRMLIVCFLASYLKYLLFSEVDVEIFSWMPNGDEVTEFSNGVYGTIYEILSYCICENKLSNEKKHLLDEVIECLPADPKNNMFYEAFIRVPSYFSNIIADHNMKDNSVSDSKICKGVEEILSYNQFLSVIIIRKNEFARVGYKQIQEDTNTKKRMTGFIIHGFAAAHMTTAALLAQTVVGDEAVLTALTIAMIVSIAQLNGAKWSTTEALAFLGVFIGDYIGTRGVTFLFKWIPALGNLANVFSTLWTTEFLGWATYAFFNEGFHDPSKLSEQEKEKLTNEAKKLNQTEGRDIKDSYRNMSKSDQKIFDEIIEKLKNKDISEKERDIYLHKLKKIVKG